MSCGLTSRATVACTRRTMHHGSRDHDDLRSFGSIGCAESLVVVVLMQPDVVLYHDKDNFHQINQKTRQFILKRRVIWERNQASTREYTTRRHLMKNHPGF